MRQIQELNPDNDLVCEGFLFSPSGLVMEGNPTFNQWQNCGEFIKKCHKATHFWIGDWLNFGEQKYGEMYAQALSETNYSYDTLVLDKYVSKNVPFLRRRSNLTFEHHKEVASLSPSDQEKLLAEAEKEKMDRNTFRNYVKHYKTMKELSELPPEEENRYNMAMEHMAMVEVAVSACCQLMEELTMIPVKILEKEAKGYLYSHLIKLREKMGTVFSLYDEMQA